MNLTAPLLLLLPTLGLVFNDLMLTVDQVVQHSAWKSIRVSICGSTQFELIDQVIQLLSKYDLPITVSSGYNSTSIQDSLEVIFGDDIDAKALNRNRVNQKIYFLNSKALLVEKQNVIRGNILILLWRTGEMFCRNPLMRNQWLQSPSICLYKSRSYNQRMVTVFVRPNVYSPMEKDSTGTFHLTGFYGLILNDLQRHLNVTFKFIVPQSRLAQIDEQSPKGHWQPVTKQFQGVSMGKFNKTLFAAPVPGDNVLVESSDLHCN